MFLMKREAIKLKKKKIATAALVAITIIGSNLDSSCLLSCISNKHRKVIANKKKDITLLNIIILGSNVFFYTLSMLLFLKETVL